MSTQSSVPNAQSSGGGGGTVNQGTPAVIANAWPVKVTDGTREGTVKAASAAAAVGDTSFVIALSPNSPLPTGTNMIGTVIDGGGTKVTYCAAILGFTPAATATDIFTITGSGTKTVKVARIGISAAATGNVNAQIQLLKRSTANTGGTSAAVTAVPYDSTNAAATATALSYTANPTLGTLVGAIRTDRLGIQTPGTNGSVNLVYEFGNTFGQPVTLRGTSEVLSVNMNGVTISGNSFDIYLVWTEE